MSEPPFHDGITDCSKVVVATPVPGGELSVGDTGVVRAAWLRANILVLWDKDLKLRSVHRKRLRLQTGSAP